MGMIPVGWYPGAIADRQCEAAWSLPPTSKACRGTQRNPKMEMQKGFNSHQYFGSLSLVPIPTKDELLHSRNVWHEILRAPRIANARLPPRPNQPPRAIPQRIGEPSLIKHGVYIIKENRTFDQVFGAFGRGNGDPSLCVFGREITPNHHKIADQFVLLDNTYCCGILSADGHQWSTTAYSTDYMEKSFAGFPRSYPGWNG